MQKTRSASALAALAALSACFGGPPIVTASSVGCSVLIPADWKDGVAGAELPTGDEVGDWIAFGDAQTGKLDVANGRTRDTITIVQNCEKRDGQATRPRGFFGRLFG